MTIRLFRRHHAAQWARSGRLAAPNGKWTPTPFLFPVVNLLTGTTPRGGGIWKYILREFIPKGVSFMTQALQFLDFGLTPTELDRWITNPDQTVLDRYLTHYREDQPDLEYHGLAFLDSGGYKFLSNPTLDLSRYGIRQGDQAWRGIYRIQRGIGGDIYTSLDYPLRPGLVDDEAAELAERSLLHALRALRQLRQDHGEQAPFFLPCHGRTAEEMQSYLKRFYQQAGSRGLLNPWTGIAIGSLVPLRTVQRFAEILAIVQGARAGIPESLQEQTPIHVFGITGSLIPLLVYLGVDSFDSSSYIQNARTLDYYLPDRGARTRFLELEGEHLPCDCPHCTRWPLRDLHQVMVGESRSDLTKSEVYARIALHNLHWDFDLVKRTRQAVQEEAMDEFLVEHAARFPVIRPAVELLARENASLVASLSRRHFSVRLPERSKQIAPAFPAGPYDLDQYDPGQPPWLRSTDDRHASPLPLAPAVRQFSLKYTPDSFNVPSGWAPHPEKDLLLILPCSETKPYRDSHSHRAIFEFIERRLGSVSRIQKVTLSGLYGPVPAEFEDHRAITEYDFRLAPSDEAQIQLCTVRLTEFLRRYGDRFTWCGAYVTSRAYRDVLRRTAALNSRLALLPQPLPRQYMTELFRKEHLDQLAGCILSEVCHHDDRITQSTLA